MSHYTFASTTIFVPQGLILSLPASTAFETALHSTVKTSSFLTHTHMHQINILSPWNDNSHLFLGDTPLLEDFSSFGQRGMRSGRISLPGTGISLQTNPTQMLQPRQILLLAFILPGWFY